jgi:cell division protein FtsA
MKRRTGTEVAQRTLPFTSDAPQGSRTPKLRLPRSGPPEMVAALDLGTSKITCIIARAEDDLLKVCSVATEPSRGIERGEVTDLDKAADAAGAAVAKAQEAAAVQCSGYFVGVGTRRSQGRNSRGSFAIPKERQVISDKTIRRALENAQNVMLPSDRQIIDSVPQSFSVDDTTGVRNPTGMSGNLLEAEVYFATESISSTRNITACLRAIGCSHEGLLFEPFATAEAVLTDDEKELGAVQIDIGEGTMDIVVYCGGAPRFTRVLPVGGGHIVRDVAVGLATTLAAARELVHSRGVACETMLATDEAKQDIHVPTADSEGFEIARKEVQRAGLNGHGARVVLTGGTALLKGIRKKAEQVFTTSARIGRPKIYVDNPELGDNPAYATAVGLLVYGIKMRRLIEKEHRHPLVNAAVKSFNWVREFF